MVFLRVTSMLFAILVALLFIGLIVFVVFAAKQWHWLHIVAVILVFLTGVPAVYCAGYVLKVRKDLVAKSYAAVSQAQAARQEYYERLYGAEAGPRGGFGKGSLKAAVTDNRLLTMGRGRIWETANVATVAPGKITLDIPVVQAPAAGGAEQDDAGGNAPDAAAQPAAAAANPVENLTGAYPTPSSLVYLFEATGQKINVAGPNSDQGSEQQIIVPGNYLGTVRVLSVNGTRVETSPEAFLPESLKADTPVVIYEKPPTDFHGVMQLALGFEESDSPSIDDVRDKYQASFPPEMFGMQATDAAYIKMLDDISFDRRPVTEIDQWLSAKGRPSLVPSPEEIMIKVRVLQDIAADVDGTQDMVANGAFDTLGRTNDPGLMIGKQGVVVKSRQGDETDVFLVDARTGETGYTRPDGTQIKSLQEEGKVEIISQIYFRRLHDYSSEIEQKRLDMQLAQERIKEYEAYQKASDEIYANTQSQVALRDDVISKLSEDQRNLESDLRSVQDYGDNLEDRLAQLKKQIRESYLQIGFIHQKRIERAAASAGTE